MFSSCWYAGLLVINTASWLHIDKELLSRHPARYFTACDGVCAVFLHVLQKLAFIDVAKGIRMFAKLSVPCVAVVEKMSFFDGQDGQRYYPFGRGSGDRIVADFGLPHLVRFPIVPDLSQAGDGERTRLLQHLLGDLKDRVRLHGSKCKQHCWRVPRLYLSFCSCST